MRMKELEERTGVNRESIRIMLRKGLLPEPERPRQTVAHYTEQHVQAILAVRRLQQRHRMTLDEIGEMLNGREIEPRAETGFSHLDALLRTSLGHAEDHVPIATLDSVNPHAASDAKAFEAIGLIERIKTKSGYVVGRDDAHVLAIWGKMRAAGFAEDTNFYPEMLDHYFQSAQLLAYHEAERFLSRTEGRLDEEKAAQMLHVALPLMLDMFAVLRMKFFLRNISRDAGTGKHRVRMEENIPDIIKQLRKARGRPAA